MKLIQVSFSIIIIIAAGSFTSAQEKCSVVLYKKYLHNIYAQKYKQNAPSDGNDSDIIDDAFLVVIPVVVHIIHNNESKIIGGPNNGNISEAQIYSQIQALNEDYRKQPGSLGYNTDPAGADCGIEFKLARKDPSGNEHSGINRIYHSKREWTFSEENTFKSLSYWPSDLYLNLWIVNLTGSNLGYGQYPTGTVYPDLDLPDAGKENDGVVIDFTAFGREGELAAKYNLGRTATHEIGHWLGLQHVWGDRYCGTDYIDDTPAQESENLVCRRKYSTCYADTTYDMINNYMDYTPDACMNIFTIGQKNRMRRVLNTSPRRRKLVESLLADSTIMSVNQHASSDLIVTLQNDNNLNIKLINRTANSEIVVTDLLGKNVYQKSILPNTGGEFIVENMHKGLCVVKYVLPNIAIVKKVLIP